jgi:hypothetical protein
MRHRPARRPSNGINIHSNDDSGFDTSGCGYGYGDGGVGDDGHLLPYVVNGNGNNNDYYQRHHGKKYRRKKRVRRLLDDCIRKTRQFFLTRRRRRRRPAANVQRAIIIIGMMIIIVTVIILVRTSSKHHDSKSSKLMHHNKYWKPRSSSNNNNTKWQINNVNNHEQSSKSYLNYWWDDLMKIVTMRQIGVRKIHPISIDLGRILWDDNMAIKTKAHFRAFPFRHDTTTTTTTTTSGSSTKQMDSDYGTLIYQSIRNQENFARVIPGTADSHDGGIAMGAFDSSSSTMEDDEEESGGSSGSGTSRSHPQYWQDGTKVSLPKNATIQDLMQYYDDDCVTVLPNSMYVNNENENVGETSTEEDRNDDRPRACQAPEFTTLYFPTCNNFHELAIDRPYDARPILSTMNPRPGHEMDTTYLASGFYRDAWLVEDCSWIWLYPPYSIEAERQQQQQQRLLDERYDVFDEDLAKYLINKGYQSAVLKTYQTRHDFDYDAFQMMRSEAIVMERLTKSPRIMNIYGHCAFSTLVEVVPIEFEQAMVYEEGYQEYEVVEKRNENGIRPFNNFTTTQKLGFALEMAESLAELHGFEDGVIVHDDVQLIQWLRTPDGKLKLGDFNRVTIMKWDLMNNEYCPFNNGLIYGNNRAPEECSALDLNEKIDLFSLGNNIYAMITGLWMFVSSLSLSRSICTPHYTDT